MLQFHNKILFFLFGDNIFVPFIDEQYVKKDLRVLSSTISCTSRLVVGYCKQLQGYALHVLLVP